VEDWLSANSTFSDRNFEQTFRLTRGTVERLIQACGNHAPAFFTTKANCVGKAPISIEVKVLGILKCIAYGCSGRAFQDYHQMAPNTFTEGLKAFFRALKADSALQGQYMRAPTKSDIKRITDLHERVHGVPGMLGCLDCLHVYWKNCPVAWQGQFKNGRYKYSSVVVEAMVDHNLWFWHASVGHAGTNSDTNIWDVSPLLQALLSDKWASECDFEFVLDGQVFDKLWILVDGIYPPIARFVKTLSFPVGEVAKMFAKWQEATRKDVERSFGVLTRKFQILARPLEYWHLEDTKRIISGCLVMHNMMVEVRIDRDEADDSGMYNVMDGGDAAAVKARATVLDGHVETVRGYQPHNDHVEDHVALAMLRWNGLYSDVSHARLQSAMMNHLAAGYIALKERSRAAC
jgi:Plant transposon protein